jgi:ELWxxDGT repeat protein
MHIQMLERRQLLAASLVKSLNVEGMFDVNGTLFMEANDGVSGTELWKSNGTAAGTVLVKDATAGAASSNIFLAKAVGSKLFYAISGGAETGGLWVSDGTSAGTLRLRTWTNFGNPPTSASFGGKYYISGFLDNEYAVWVSDGTVGGTRKIATTPNIVRELVPSGTKLYFTDNSTLWSYDGTTVRTVTSALSSIRRLADVNGKLYFSADDPNVGIELWTSTGTNAALFRDFWPGPGDSRASVYVASGGNSFFFGADDGVHDGEIWKSDGTANGSFMVADISADTFTGGTNALDPVAMGGKMYFVLFYQGQYQLWVSDGTAVGTRRLHEISTSPGASVDKLTVAGTTLYFTAFNEATGLEAYKTDGSASGLKSLGDLIPGFGSGLPGANEFVVSGSTVFFDGSRIDTGSALFKDSATSGFISGQVWQDRNGDGIYGPNDSRIAGRTVYNDANNNNTMDASEPRTTTDAEGRYFFAEQPAGNYKIRQIRPSGWQQVLPVSNFGQTFTLAAGAADDLNDFTSRISNTGVLTGSVFDDFNGNGARDGFDRGAANRTVFNDTDNDGVLDANEVSAVSDSSGNFKLLDVPAGTFRVRQVLPLGAVATTPATRTGTLADAGEVVDLSFGSDPAPASLSISGTAYHDGDRNGTFNTTLGRDVVLPGVRVFLDVDQDGLFDSGEPVATSDSLGKFTISSLDYGQYMLRPVLDPPWTSGTQTTTTLLSNVSNALVGFRGDMALADSEYSADDQRLSLTFNIPPTFITSGSFTLTVNGMAIAANQYAVSLDSGLGKIFVAPSPGNAFADGNYALSAPSNAIRDRGNFPLNQPLAVSYFVFKGDANRDRTVNIGDFSILATNFNKPGTFSQGDFNYSGQVEIGDFSILASKFNTSLPALPRSSGQAAGGVADRQLAGFTSTRQPFASDRLISSLTSTDAILA